MAIAFAWSRVSGEELDGAGEPVVAGGDVIVAIAGRPVTDADALVRIVTNNLRPGQHVPVAYVRNGRRRRVSITLAARPAG